MRSFVVYSTYQWSYHFGEDETGWCMWHGYAEEKRRQGFGGKT
jgi:hypothetical protein